MMRVHYETPPRPPAPAATHLLAEAAEGVRAIVQDRGLAVIVGLACAQTFTRGALTVFTVVVALDLLDTGEAGVGNLTAAVGAGAVVGSLVASLLVGSRWLGGWFGIGVAMWGLPIALIGLFPAQSTALILLACVGIGNALVDLGGFTLLARLAPDDVLARVFGVFESLITLSVGVGSIIASVVIELFGVRVALVAVGLLCPIAVLAALPSLLRLDRFIGVRDQEIGLLQQIPMLSPLPLPAIEQLARGLAPVAVPAGQVVFHQGDVGDRYYVIESGEAEVIGDEEPVATLGAGEGFGEIALLRRVPRTATVQALTKLELRALSCEHFLPVVTGFPPSAREAGTSVDTMLDRFTPHDQEETPE